MEFSLLLMKQISVMFIMIGVGYLVVRLGLLTSDDSAVLSRITLYVISPCMLITACQIEYTPQRLEDFGVALVLAFAINLAFVLLTAGFNKVYPLSGAEQASLTYANSGNLIIPLISVLIGTEGIFRLSAFLLAQTVIFWTHGVYVMGGRKAFSLKKIVTNPNLIAAVAGVGLFVGRVTLPELPRAAVSQLAQTIGPLCMLIVGMVIAGADLKKVFSDKRAYIATFGRLIAYPVLTILVFWALGAGSWDPRFRSILTIFIICTAAPSASNVPQAAKVFEANAELAGVINIMSVLLCIITIPLMMLFYQALCGAV